MSGEQSQGPPDLHGTGFSPPPTVQPRDSFEVSDEGLTMDMSEASFTIEDLTVNINTVDRAELVEACLGSLIKTTPAGAKLQILFNGSPKDMVERTITQAEAWDGPTNFIQMDEIVPVHESHNLALEAVSTRLVNFMGDDDFVLGERFPLIIDCFNQTTPTPAVVTTFAKRIAGDPFEPTIGSNKDLGPTTVESWQEWHDSGKPFELLWPGSVLRTDALRAIGGWEEAFAASFDNRIFSQMSFQGPVLAVPDRQFGFRIHQGSLSTTNWRKQNQVVRFVAACQRANVAGQPEPTLAEFEAQEAADSAVVRWKRDLRDRSRIHFRKGGALALSGQRASGFGHLAASVALWPPAFAEKVRDQFSAPKDQ